MEESPKNNPGQAGKAGQQGAEANAPKSGERPDQGEAPAPDHYRPDPQAERDQAPIPAPDNLGAKDKYPVLAQPTEELTRPQARKPHEKSRPGCRPLSSPCSSTGARRASRAAPTGY